MVSPLPRCIPLPKLVDLEGRKSKLDEFVSALAQVFDHRKAKSQEKKKSRQEVDLCEKIQLADGKAAYIFQGF